MNSFFKLLLGVMAAALVLGRSSVALANGGDWHLGGVATGISVFVVWIGGGVVGILILFFFIGWGLSSRARKRSHRGETENNLQKTNGENK
jgi:hypothetical protein